MSEADAADPVVGRQDVLRIPANVRDLASVRRFIRETGQRMGADTAVVPDIVQAVDESITNVIVHGYRGADGTVEVEVDRSGRAFIVRLRDHAAPFDPTLLPSPDTSLPLDERPLGGMGVFLTRELMDEVTYRKTRDGNELTLVKRCINHDGGERC